MKVYQAEKFKLFVPNCPFHLGFLLEIMISFGKLKGALGFLFVIKIVFAIYPYAFPFLSDF